MKYSKELLENAAKQSRSVRETCLNLGIQYVSGSMQTHISRKLKEFDIDTSHFLGTGWNKGGQALNRKSAAELLILRSEGARTERRRLLRVLLEIGRKYECENCGNLGLWMEQTIRLEVHHKDNNPLNNLPENLSILCPNCHAIHEI